MKTGVLILVCAGCAMISCRSLPVATVKEVITDSTVVTETVQEGRALIPIPADRINMVFKINCQEGVPHILPVFSGQGKIINMDHEIAGDMLNVNACVVDSAAVAATWLERHTTIEKLHNAEKEIPVVIEKPLSKWQQFILSLGYVVFGGLLLLAGWGLFKVYKFIF